MWLGAFQSCLLAPLFISAWLTDWPLCCRCGQLECDESCLACVCACGHNPFVGHFPASANKPPFYCSIQLSSLRDVSQVWVSLGQSVASIASCWLDCQVHHSDAVICAFNYPNVSESLIYCSPSRLSSWTRGLGVVAACRSFASEH